MEEEENEIKTTILLLLLGCYTTITNSMMNKQISFMGLRPYIVKKLLYVKPDCP